MEQFRDYEEVYSAAKKGHALHQKTDHESCPSRETYFIWVSYMCSTEGYFLSSRASSEDRDRIPPGG